MNKKNSLIVIATLLMLLFSSAHAQNLRVESVKHIPNSMAARSNQRNDGNGKPGALLQIQSSLELEEVKGNYVGDPVKKRSSETWVWLTDGSIEVDLCFKNHSRLHISFEEYGIAAVEGNNVYEIQITEDIVLNKESVPQNSVTFNVTPRVVNSVVHINGKDYQTKNGTLTLQLPYGPYDYTVSAPGFGSVNKSFFLDNQEHKPLIELEPKSAYALINQYEQSAELGNEREVERFAELFESRDLMIYNDLMGLCYEPTLTVAEYVKLLHQKAEMTNVRVRNVQMVGEVEDRDSVWQLSVSIDKSISFYNVCSTFFDSYEFFGVDYPLLFTLSMNKSTGSCYITGLRLDGTPERFKFPSDYRVLVRKDKRDKKLTINDSIIRFNLFDQMLLHPDDKIKYLGSDVEEEKVKGECDNKVYAKYNDKAFRIRPNLAFSLTDFNKLSGAPDYLKTSKAGEMSFGVDVGYAFPSTGRLQTGVFVGIGLSSNSLTMEMPSNGKVFESNADNYDEDGDSYIRKYQIGKDSVGSITQEMKASDIAIPVYLDLEYRVAPMVSVYGDLGLKFQTSTGKITGSTSHGYTTWGEYPQYGIKEMGKNGEVNLNGFGYYSAGDIEIDETGVTKSMAIDALLGLGVRLNVSKSFAIDAGVQYQTGTKSWKTNKSSDIAHYTDNGDGTASDKFYSFIRHGDGISHGALKAAISLIFKF